MHKTKLFCFENWSADNYGCQATSQILAVKLLTTHSSLMVKVRRSNEETTVQIVSSFNGVLLLSRNIIACCKMSKEVTMVWIWVGSECLAIFVFVDDFLVVDALFRFGSCIDRHVAAIGEF